MMNANSDSSVKISYKGNNNFQAAYLNHFLVLPDAKTIVGVDGSDREKLVMEDISEGKSTLIGKNSDEISSLLFHSPTQSLLVGDIDGYIKQYKKLNGSFTLVKDYGDVDVGSIWSSAQVGQFAIFGGSNGSLVVIDIKNKMFIKGFLETAYESINSLQVCFTNYHRIFLSVSGIKPDFSSGKSNIFDITCMGRNDPSSFKNFPYKNLSEANQAILVQQMAIESLEEKIEGLNKYKYEHAIYKQKLKEAEIKYQSLEKKYQSNKIENESIRDKFLILKPKIDKKNKRLNQKLFIIDKLRRQYTQKFHEPPKFTFFDNEDKSKTISDLENEISLLNDRNIHIANYFHQSIENQKINKEKEESLKIKSEKIEKQILDFYDFIKKR